MPDIGIIGGGIGGTHLGLFLRQHGVSATIYSAKTPAEHLGARITNVVCRSGTTRARERALGVDFWDAAAPELEQFVVTVNGPQPLTFSGALNPPTHVVDMRIYWARLLEEFAAWRHAGLSHARRREMDIDASAPEPRADLAT